MAGLEGELMESLFQYLMEKSFEHESSGGGFYNYSFPVNDYRIAMANGEDQAKQPTEPLQSNDSRLDVFIYYGEKPLEISTATIKHGLPGLRSGEIDYLRGERAVMVFAVRMIYSRLAEAYSVMPNHGYSVRCDKCGHLEYDTVGSLDDYLDSKYCDTDPGYTLSEVCDSCFEKPGDKMESPDGAQREYVFKVSEGGNQCPACGCSEVEGNEVVIEGSLAFQEVGCNECSAMWNDVYKLDGYSDLRVEPLPIFTMEDWKDCNSILLRLKPGQRVEDDVYEELMNAVPPVRTSKGSWVGEAYDSDENGRGRYMFFQRDSGVWVYQGLRRLE